MTRGGEGLEYRRLRAPRRHGQKLIDPPLKEAASGLRRNIEIRQARDVPVLGQTIHELARQTRRDLIQQAVSYSREYGDIDDVDVTPSTPVIATGHQPSLFHPGVSFKNFVLDEAARKTGAVALNFLIDNDVLGEPSLRVPTGCVDRPRQEVVAFDRFRSPLPYEERGIFEPETFASFADRAGDTIRPLVPRPLVREFWPSVVAAAKETGRVGLAVARARHQLERSWGLNTLDLPLSHACRSAGFRRFLAHILTRLREFRHVHNRTLHEYRRVNRVRSRTHPVPELGGGSDWLEAPFWVWTRDHPERRPLYVRAHGGTLQFTDVDRLPLSPTAWKEETAETRLLEQLEALESRGVKLRPRALTTTMFLRLFACDLFVHGIGGTKYDELTDAILESFFSVTPPRFVTATATLQLPIDRPAVLADDLRKVDRQLRELRFHPERHVPPTAESKELVDEKLRWIADATSQKRRERHQRIEAVNERLLQLLQDDRRQLEQRRDRIDRLLRGERILASREFSFCLFPESIVRGAGGTQ